MADAIRARARYLITTDVDDFAFEDLVVHELGAVNPDYFTTAPPPYPQTPINLAPFRGVACVRCESHLDGEDGRRLGLCLRHQAR